MEEARSDLQRQAQRLVWLATGVFCVVTLAMLFEVWMVTRSPDPTAAARFTVPFRLPMLFYLAGIGTLRAALVHLSRGAMFDRVLPILLRRLGLALAGGGFASVFLTPWLWLLFRGLPRGPWASFDPPAITIGLVGLLLVVLAQLHRRAEAMKRELDEFF